jgi:hypothetical protein
LKVIEMWEGTFKEKPYCEFFAHLLNDNEWTLSDN